MKSSNARPELLNVSFGPPLVSFTALYSLKRLRGNHLRFRVDLPFLKAAFLSESQTSLYHRVPPTSLSFSLRFSLRFVLGFPCFEGGINSFVKPFPPLSSTISTLNLDVSL